MFKYPRVNSRSNVINDRDIVKERVLYDGIYLSIERYLL